MLQSVGSEHDSHYESGHSNSIEALVAARNDGKKHLLLAYAPCFPSSLPVIVAALDKYQDSLSIRIVLTESATHFLSGQSDEQPTVDSLLYLPNVDAVYRDHHEWGPRPWRRGARADMLVVAPLSANTLAKVRTRLYGRRDRRHKPRILTNSTPAMWRNPVTNKQIRVLTDDWGVKEKATGPASETRSIIGWFKVITPISKTLACSDTGDDQSFRSTAATSSSDGANPIYVGAMASVESICEAIERDLNLTVEN
ncbi:hypothetical protein CHGG_07096 [Chaetomium globosum CBS 148.51]|uniref:Flavoprotein domain-containing protein n=1 Tax=Chaetomium globosum (strain ATCC 6205 / CBS 148.51 / DSM 1962 / NBRC 6347 / NRRL 1970) TaxID=306901 RepID=Q2GY58_CHAGB|nr:uncharacterized protein CHGG_07096 [Chaetomium globosum CBS 148.51]EAQ85843.1 hypothetical protein CHGG_07096 [Chaetomium globosum CBS 148.51]